VEVIKKFKELSLPPLLVEALDSVGFDTPTPIQAGVIPAALAGKDILGIAPTGTGKTGAFGIPALASIYPEPGKQILILAPTRELAAQIFKFIGQLGEKLKLSGSLLVGGESFSRQRREIIDGVDVMVATPGRLNDHLSRGLGLSRVAILVLDEVDTMLDMGFAPQVEEILGHLPPKRQTFLFSATMPPEIKRLADRLLTEPERVSLANNPSQAPKIHEEQINTTPLEKGRLLLDQVAACSGKILIFVNTKGHVEHVARRLDRAGQPAAYLHGGRSHGERKRALEAFREGEVRILVATDIASRGIDVLDIEHVINYDYPATKEDYLHRIGRTGRIGKKGHAVTFIDGRNRRFPLNLTQEKKAAPVVRPKPPQRYATRAPQAPMPRAQHGAVPRAHQSPVSRTPRSPVERSDFRRRDYQPSSRPTKRPVTRFDERRAAPESSARPRHKPERFGARPHSASGHGATVPSRFKPTKARDKRKPVKIEFTKRPRRTEWQPFPPDRDFKSRPASGGAFSPGSEPLRHRGGVGFYSTDDSKPSYSGVRPKLTARGYVPKKMYSQASSAVGQPNPAKKNWVRSSQKSIRRNKKTEEATPE